MRCDICSQPAVIHHIFTRGAYGKRAENDSNMIPLCITHHTEVHTIGRKTFAEKYGLEDRFEGAWQSTVPR